MNVGLLLGLLVGSLLGGDEGSAEGSLPDDADGITDCNLVGFDVGNFDATSVGIGDGAVLDTDGAVVDLSYPEQMQHALATVFPKLSNFLSAIKASHQFVSFPKSSQPTPLKIKVVPPDLHVESFLQFVGLGLTVSDVLGPSDGMLDGRYEGMADFSDGTAVTAGARVRSHVLQVFLQISLDGEK